MGTLRRALVVGLLGTFALCAVGPLLQWAAGQALQLIADGVADGLRAVGWGLAGALLILAGGGVLVGSILALGWVGAQRDRAALELLQAVQPSPPLAPPADVIDGIYQTMEEPYGENSYPVRPQLRRGSPRAR